MVWTLQLGRPLLPWFLIENHEYSQTGLALSHAFIDGDGSGERDEAGERIRVNIVLSFYSARTSCLSIDFVQLLRVLERMQTWTCLHAAAHAVTT